MFFTCCCWSKTPPRRSRWMRMQRSWTPETMRAESMKWTQFGTTRSMQESQQAIYRDSTTWYFGKDIWKKKTPESHTQLFNILGNLSDHSIGIIQRSRQQLLKPLTLHHQWSGQQLNQQLNQLLSLPNKSEANQLTTPRNSLKRAELSLIFIMFLAFFRRCGYQLS